MVIGSGGAGTSVRVSTTVAVFIGVGGSPGTSPPCTDSTCMLTVDEHVRAQRGDRRRGAEADRHRPADVAVRAGHRRRAGGRAGPVGRDQRPRPRLERQRRAPVGSRRARALDVGCALERSGDEHALQRRRGGLATRHLDDGALRCGVDDDRADRRRRRDRQVRRARRPARSRRSRLGRRRRSGTAWTAAMSTGMRPAKPKAPVESVCAVTLPRLVVIVTVAPAIGTAVAAGLALPTTMPDAEANGPARRIVGPATSSVPTATADGGRAVGVRRGAHAGDRGRGAAGGDQRPVAGAQGQRDLAVGVGRRRRRARWSDRSGCR